MNYFELFELPVSLQVDKDSLSKKYFELQRKYHPDYFLNASEEEQAEVLEKSSMINRGYKIFQNTDDTLKYVLQMKGLLEEEEKYELPATFLMEMMELNESLMATDGSSFEEMETKVSQLEKHLYDNIRNIIEYYSDTNTTTEQLLLVKDYYFKKKYLGRILERMEGMRNIADQK
jgi:molecular chaperone HscB